MNGCILYLELAPDGGVAGSRCRLFTQSRSGSTCHRSSMSSIAVGSPQRPRLAVAPTIRSWRSCSHDQSTRDATGQPARRAAHPFTAGATPGAPDCATDAGRRVTSTHGATRTAATARCPSMCAAGAAPGAPSRVTTRIAVHARRDGAATTTSCPSMHGPGGPWQGAPACAAYAGRRSTSTRGATETTATERCPSKCVRGGSWCSCSRVRRGRSNSTCGATRGSCCRVRRPCSRINGRLASSPATTS